MLLRILKSPHWGIAALGAIFGCNIRVVGDAMMMSIRGLIPRRLEAVGR